MKNHTQESLEEARLQGKWDKEDRRPIQNHFPDDDELHAAYLDGYDPNGEIVKKIDCPREETCEPNCSFCESDKEHYQQMSEFFDEMIEHISFHSFVARCSRCGKPECSNVGIISGKTIFAFCVDCRDELTLKQNAARAALERIGA